MAELSPRLWDIRISYDLLADLEPRLIMLGDEEYRALHRLVSACAAGLVWTYTEPSDGSLDDDDGELSRIARLSLRRWRKVRPAVAVFFTIRGGKWRLNEPWISIDTGAQRFAIPDQIRASILRREGRRCTYCGDLDGPFDYDHIFPVSRGGTNDPSNLTLACATCNRSKGSKTLVEWMAWRALTPPPEET